MLELPEGGGTWEKESMRVLAWFSCGAASAAAAYLAIQKYGDACVVLYCDTMKAEHPDNTRFFSDVEQWLGRTIVKLKSERFDSIDKVFSQTRYMAGIKGARCTVEMKKIPRFLYQKVDDIHVFGFTADEIARVERFHQNNPELSTDFCLVKRRWRKSDCLALLEEVEIAAPVMYALGYRNNNCLGCVKATSARYWQMIRRDFPAVFERRARQSRELGVRLTRLRGERIFLDELPADYLPAEPLENISCGPDCGNEGIK